MTRFCFLTGEVSVGAVDVGGVMLGVSEKGIEVLRTYSLRGVGSTPEIRGEEVRAKR